MSWRRSKQAREEKPAAVPRGCVAVLAGDMDGAGGGGGERVVVEVRALGRPCVRALLEKAAAEFGYDHKGVVRIPCSVEELRAAVDADTAAARCRW